MTGTPALHDRAPREPDVRPAASHDMPLWAGVLWMIGIAGAWTILLVLFHNLMARLLR